VYEDAKQEQAKSIVQTSNTIFFEYFSAAVNQAIELYLSSTLADIDS